MENDYYATFRVIEKMTGKMGESGANQVFDIKHQAGTLADIKNAFSATIENDMRLLQSAARNKAVRDTMLQFMSEEAQEATGLTVTPAKRGADGKFVIRDNSDVRTVSFLEDGVYKAYDVNAKFGDVLLYRSEAQADWIKALRVLGDVSRDIFINKNPGFWAYNVPRDWTQTTKNLPTSITGIGDFSKYYAKAMLDATAYVTTGKVTPEMRAALRDMTMVSSGAYVGRDADGIDTELLRTMARYNVGDGKRGGLVAGASRQINKVMEIQEKGMKLAAYNFLKEADIPASYVKGVSKKYKSHFVETGRVDKKGRPIYRVDDAMRNYMVRTMAGTSDVVAGGRLSPLANNVFLFLNSRIQGMYSTIEAMKLNPSAYAKKFLARDVSTTVTYALASGGLLAPLMTPLFEAFGGTEELAKKVESMINAIPDYHKAGFLAIPTGIDPETGKVSYFLVPKSYEGQAISAATYHMAKMVVGKITKTGEGMKAEAGKAFKSIISDNNPFDENSLIPLLQVGATWAKWFFGNDNPMDSWTGRPILSNNVRTQGMGAEAVRLLRWSWSKMGLDAFIDIYKLMEMADPDNEMNLIEKSHAVPVVGKPVRRFYRMSNDTVEGSSAEARKQKTAESTAKQAQRKA
ncbi:MAG: hypothetical protein FWC23_03375 [Chitinispirillia bacterium]|nr:hypothetical protein [Chitinispirillia bacterium]MCL2268217.1 hypothetical protein [Chitinispirillia bacterium]